ncbi:unnamed protein product [Heligmosomoides polygyrus]|uniref:KH_dom_type_1 domain-containing protein n=1 Tax=Heligmosomoides polygyrus TaxID=6339 RepID=A0A183G6I7_HELPZ|nr:unnamed protein product [Heligmosomoides polygyrus]
MVIEEFRVELDNEEKELLSNPEKWFLKLPLQKFTPFVDALENWSKCHVEVARDEVVLLQVRDIGRGFKAVISGSPRTTSGIGIIVSERFRASIVSIKRFDGRLVKIVVAAKKLLCHFFSTYAPQIGCSKQSKDVFWSLRDEKTAVVQSKMSS